MKKEVTLNIIIPDEAQRALLDELIWEFHRKHIKLKATSRGSDDVFSVTYETNANDEMKK